MGSGIGLFGFGAHFLATGCVSIKPKLSQNDVFRGPDFSLQRAEHPGTTVFHVKKPRCFQALENKMRMPSARGRWSELIREVSVVANVGASFRRR
jgi:hypothetical protein